MSLIKIKLIHSVEKLFSNWMCQLHHGPNLFLLVLNKILNKDIKPVNPKGNQSWIFIGRTDAEAEAAILWPFDVKSWLIGKDPDAGKNWGQEEKGETENNMDGWHHWLNSHHFEQIQGDGEGQGSLACCSSWDHRESDTTWWLNNKILNMLLTYMVVRTKIWMHQRGIL